MASTSLVRIELLNRDNYDTWKIQMQALLTKNDTWEYTSGKKPKPEIIPGNAKSLDDARKWELEDGKAKADIILSIKPSELKQIKDCNTSHELWQKLQTIYQSSGPARKATLIKQLTYHHMEERSEVREHLLKFFDTVDKLSEMDVDINNDLLSVMLLHSLPTSFENFRCAIESRDTLPESEALRIKILEESDARKHKSREGTTYAMFAKKKFGKKRDKKTDQESGKESKTQGKKEQFRFKCHRCRKVGHKAADRTEPSKSSDNANAADDVNLFAIENSKFDDESKNEKAFQVENEKIWCMDSGCTSYMCGSDGFIDIREYTDSKVNLTMRQRK